MTTEYIKSAPTTTISTRSPWSRKKSGEYTDRTSRIHGTVTLRPSDELTFSLMTGSSTSSAISGSAETFLHTSTVAQGRNGTAQRSANSSESQILEMTGT